MGGLPEEARVLLAEDDEDFITLLKDAMALAGWRVNLLVARDGEAVLEYFAQPGAAMPALLLLDLQLPGLPGMEVLQKLRASPATRALPVIILTSCSSATAVYQAHFSGANSYILKPEALAGLVEKLTALRDFLQVSEQPT
jgi:two-component system, response regulator